MPKSHSHLRWLLARLGGNSKRGLALADSHGFLHQRVTLYTKLLFLFFAAFTALGSLKFITVAKHGGYARENIISSVILVALTAGLGFDWLHLRRKRCSITRLHLYESVGTIFTAAVLGSLTFLMPSGIPQVGLFLMVVLVLVIRAAIVPSEAGRTAAVGMVSIVILAALFFHRGGGHPPLPDLHEDIELYLLTNAGRFMWALVAGWGLIFVIATAILSRVIFRLQTTVRQAMELGNYTLDEKLGEGGMGVVYLAHHAMLQRPTALKLLPPDKAGEETVTRFEREVQQTSRLTHPNTVEIYDFGRTPDGVFYYVMEYLDGVNLRELVELEGKQPPGRVIYILAQVAHALADAHRVGLIHRDVKPANIILCNRGGVADMAKLLDFGLVKEIDKPAEILVSTANSLTGTPQYMSPECMTAPETMDGRSDIYALGAVGYYLLTGEEVFTAGSVVEICSHHLHSEPEPPSQRLGAPLSDDLEDIILRCLAKQPAGRPTASELWLELRGCVDRKRWGLPEAMVWWADNDNTIVDFRAGSREPVVSGSEATLAVDVAGRTLVEVERN